MKSEKAIKRICLPYSRSILTNGNVNSGFSLIELLVVIAIVALLIAILLPSISRARDQARLVYCKSNLRQWGHALQMYRNDFKDYLPQEGLAVPTPTSIASSRAWYNSLPPYLGAPRYKQIEGAGVDIRELPGNHVWICPAKNISHLNTSTSGKNQFHYSMNCVLDGTGEEDGPDITPGMPDQTHPNFHVRASTFARKPFTVFMFDIYPNSPNGDPRDAAVEFHRKSANVLYIEGSVDNFRPTDFVNNGDIIRNDEWYLLNGNDIIWNNPRLYWGYPNTIP